MRRVSLWREKPVGASTHARRAFRGEVMINQEKKRNRSNPASQRSRRARRFGIWPYRIIVSQGGEQSALSSKYPETKYRRAGPSAKKYLSAQNGGRKWHIEMSTKVLLRRVGMVMARAPLSPWRAFPSCCLIVASRARIERIFGRRRPPAHGLLLASMRAQAPYFIFANCRYVRIVMVEASR